MCGLEQDTLATRRDSLASYSSSLLEEYNDEEELEKTNATLVAVLTVLIVLFFVFIFTLIFVLAFSLPSGHQSRTISHSLCKAPVRRLPASSDCFLRPIILLISYVVRRRLAWVRTATLNIN